MEEVVLGLAYKINNSDYIGWSKQMDVFTKNLVNHTY